MGHDDYMLARGQVGNLKIGGALLGVGVRVVRMHCSVNSNIIRSTIHILDDVYG
jgi:hypothetical protein